MKVVHATHVLSKSYNTYPFTQVKDVTPALEAILKVETAVDIAAAVVATVTPYLPVHVYITSSVVAVSAFD